MSNDRDTEQDQPVLADVDVGQHLDGAGRQQLRDDARRVAPELEPEREQHSEEGERGDET